MRAKCLLAFRRRYLARAPRPATGLRGNGVHDTEVESRASYPEIPFDGCCSAGIGSPLSALNRGVATIENGGNSR